MNCRKLIFKLHMRCDTDCVSVCTHGIEIARIFLPPKANMLFVSIDFSLEKDFVIFSAFVNFNIMLGNEFSRLHTWLEM